MQCERGATLEDWNTFRIPATAAYRILCTHPDELQLLPEILPTAELPLLVLGNGSNVLFTENYPGIVLRASFRGIRCVEEDPDSICVEAAAGESWHEFVHTCLQRGWHGLENLALIPGTVGAAPVHNIGAYGVEVAQCLESVRVWDSVTHEFRWIPTTELALSYRTSALRTAWLGKVVVTHVRFRLRRAVQPSWDYPELKEYLTALGILKPTPEDIFHAVCALRRRKLPDPTDFPNAGSFFRNPIVPVEHAEELQRRYPTMPCFPHGDSAVKIPAGWLLEHCGWKNIRRGNVGTWKRHALVVINHGA
ncbi:MAG: UDP-N-acetylmuramate dehydrogenase, partial [Candidatus Kapabacteria bacterium]|nr:UDP-N-acetylmuramate dehydrogenase [Candidatus Kapabacteria bacterium]